MSTPTITPPQVKPGTAPTPTRPKLTIESTSHLEQSTCAILYCGDSDTGKTHCAFSYPSPFGVYFDTNMSTLRKYPHVPYVVPADWAMVERDLLPAIRNRRLTELVRGMSAEFASYTVRTLVVDSLTFFCNQNILDLGKGGTLELENLQWDSYYARVHRLVRECCDAAKPLAGKESYWVVMTVHRASKSNKKGEVIEQGPSVQGRMYGQLSTYFDAVLLTEGRKLVTNTPGPTPDSPPTQRTTKERFAYTVDQGLIKAKNQIGPIDERVVPTYDVLAKAWGWPTPEGIK